MRYRSEQTFSAIQGWRLMERPAKLVALTPAALMASKTSRFGRALSPLTTDLSRSSDPQLQPIVETRNEDINIGVPRPAKEAVARLGDVTR